MRKLTKPVIGITKPVKKDNWAYAAVAAAVRICGGEPIALTPDEQRKRPLIHGVLFGGGQDVFPMLYDQTPKQGYVYDRDRDALELELAKQAKQEDIPALGICRGAQMMNVVRGGALYADVTAEYEDTAYPNGVAGKIFFRKTIDIEHGSLLQRAFAATCSRVNSLHKQAIKRLGKDLRVTARERNGIVQAIEDPDMHYYMGVQFHPELLIYREDMRDLFRQFIDRAASRGPVEILRDFRTG
ncbi:gamma-glutamyl-gamma-aminobutyrate hydrolase family protein [Hyphococcus sp. DH-69]|uniref:gamma-glutamyl-gamma-aminobutyrate hydrolase family protein n=1 Tax=Hyphococcus formosus TaxID=3143534 RepID=UPI00398AAF77